MSAMPKVSLNIDLGELPDEPEELYSLATMVNIACCGHAGDVSTMERATSLARASGAILAAHPSYPDRAGFGRKTLTMEPAALAASIQDQLAALASAAERGGAHIKAVKLHGALYHDAAKDQTTAGAVFDAITSVFGGANVAIVGPPRGALRDIATTRRLRYWREGFADRTYRADGRLAPRSEPDALITDPALARAQARRLAEAGTFDTLCVHGDTPGAASIARAVREELSAAGLLER